MVDMGFVHDQLATGPQLRILTVIDTFSRFSPAIVPHFNFKAADVVDVLERGCREEGYPAAIRVDQGSEFISCELDLWASTKGVTLGEAVREAMAARTEEIPSSAVMAPEGVPSTRQSFRVRPRREAKRDEASDINPRLLQILNRS